MGGVAAEVASYGDGARRWPVLSWRFDEPVLVASTASVGGGVGPRRWVLNAMVSSSYARLDVDGHVAEIAAELGLRGDGVGLLTAFDVRLVDSAEDGGVHADATVGLGWPTWAAAADAADAAETLGAHTINVVALVPARLSDAALVNAVATVAEAKAQALGEAGVEGTGTASDAIAVVCPAAGAVEPFGGPRSRWGAPLARAVHAAVAAGTAAWSAGRR